MKKIFREAIKCIFGLSILFGGTLFAHTAETLIFGTYAFDRPTITVQKMRPILNALEIRLGEQLGKPVKIKLQIARNYHVAIQDLVDGRVDFGRYGQAAYVIAKEQNSNIDILAVEGDHKKKTFQSVIIVHKNSRISSLENLAGKSFAFGSIYSTTGRYFPQEYLAARGITARKLSRYSYLQRHDRVGWSVSDRSYDAGAISKWVYEDLISRGASIRSIASFAISMAWSTLSPNVRE